MTFEEWQEAVWYGSGEGYEGTGRSFEDQLTMYEDWMECLTWSE